jgi:pathogenesis-related protein 1
VTIAAIFASACIVPIPIEVAAGQTTSSSPDPTMPSSSNSGTPRDTAGSCSGPAEPPALAGATARHNAARARVAASPPLAPVCWDAGVAAQAQAWADRCTYAHSGSGSGENLYTHTGDVRATAVAKALEFWMAEGADFDYAANRCRGKACGHFTQVAWRATRHVGCGVRVCDRNSPFGGAWPTWTLVVCNYDPPGNWRGQRPW